MELITKLGINWQLLIAQIVNFLIVMGALTALVYRPLLNLLDQRSERIRKSLQEAKRIEDEAKKVEQYRSEQMRKVDEESGVLLAEVRKKAEGIQQELLEQARSESRLILERGQQELVAERAEALADLQASLGRIVLQLTEKLLEREFSPADQKKMIASLESSLPSLLK